MRIDSLGTTADLGLGRNSVSGRQGAQAGSTGLPADTASLSGSSLSVATLSSEALALASAMQARVGALRQTVANGEYSLEPAQIATAMLGEEM